MRIRTHWLAGIASSLALWNAAAADTAPRWRAVRAVESPATVPGTFGAALAAADGRLWIGPARDEDVGVGPPQVTALGMRAGLGLPTASVSAVMDPTADPTAGFGLALSAAGDICVAGSPHAGCRGRGCDTGQVHLLSRGDDGAWAADEVTCPTPEPASQFGAAVATDGRTIVVGSPRADSGATDAGAIDVYELGDPPWRTVTHLERITSPDPRLSARFGASVAVNGDWIAVGEPNAGDGYPRPGRVHLLRRTTTGWAFHGSLRAPAGAIGWYGAAVALAGGHLVVGAPLASPAPGGPASGSAALHAWRDGRWTLDAVLAPTTRTAGDGFGLAVAVEGTWAAVGAPGDDLRGNDAGAAWIVRLADHRLERMDPVSPREGDGFGAGLAFGRAGGRATIGPTTFLAVARRTDPERPLVPGCVDLFGYWQSPLSEPEQSDGPHSRSASAIASAADRSVTGAGDQPSSRARASAAAP